MLVLWLARAGRMGVGWVCFGFAPFAFAPLEGGEWAN
jgi:hypothetical protein